MLQINSYSISTESGLLALWKLFLYYECADCMQQVYVMIELGRDGIARFYYGKPSLNSHWWQFKATLAPTEDAKVLISCDLCGREIDFLLSREGDGTSFILQNCE